MLYQLTCLVITLLDSAQINKIITIIIIIIINI
jgi:hypothetical protein